MEVEGLGYAEVQGLGCEEVVVVRREEVGGVAECYPSAELRGSRQ